MARQTRQQRRARRAQQEPALAGGPPTRGAARPTASGGAEPERRGEGRPRRQEAERHGFGPWVFVQESLAELRKVEWPDQKAVVSGTAVVLIACAIVGLFLWVNDEVWKYVVQHVLLR
ncbi:MAG TPA: preprotein translocase subunit SecE [Gaiellaceae bacterium]|nr:preprotein translocase subunit SecE [Gaiellaceae bacterium]